MTEMSLMLSQSTQNIALPLAESHINHTAVSVFPFTKQRHLCILPANGGGSYINSTDSHTAHKVKLQHT